MMTPARQSVYDVFEGVQSDDALLRRMVTATNGDGLENRVLAMLSGQAI